MEDELSQGAYRYTQWNHMHPAVPRREARDPVAYRLWERHLETQWALDYVRTQPAYNSDPLLSGTVLEAIGVQMTCGRFCVPYEGIWRHIEPPQHRFFTVSKTPTYLNKDVVICHALTDWANDFFTG